MDSSFQYIKSVGGIETEADYPYKTKVRTYISHRSTYFILCLNDFLFENCVHIKIYRTIKKVTLTDIKFTGEIAKFNSLSLTVEC